jgi:hypothetical protein
MDNIKSLDEQFAPFSRWLAKNFFNEQQGRTLSQKVEDEIGISKPVFHTVLGIAVVGLLSNYLDY